MKRVHEVMRVFFVSELLLFATALGANAAEFDDAHRKRAEDFKHDSLTLEFAIPKKSFFLGELIPIIFRFEDTKNTGNYEAWTGGYDRSGRIGSVAFHVDGEPGSYADPLAVYFSSGAFMGGGLGNHQELGKYEQVFHLNEWVRFDKPGRYRFYATSRRVSHTRDNDRHPGELVSPIIEIEITVPTAEELETAFDETTANFDPENSKNRESTYQALSQLRFLDSEKSRLRLRNMLGEGEGAEMAAMFGLIGSREVDAAIELLEKGIADSDVPITTNYMNSLAKLRRTHAFREKLAEDPKQNGFQLFGSRGDYFGDRDDWQKLVDVFDRKEGRARAVSALALFQLLRNDLRQDDWMAKARAKGNVSVGSNQHKRLDHKAVMEKVKVPLAGVFRELEEHEQESLLEYSWKLIRCPEFIEPLRQILNEPMKRPGSSHHSAIRSWALLRFSELNPDDGVPMILDDIRKLQPNYSLDVLCSLPPDRLKPELNLLAENLAAKRCDTEKIAGLIAHYGDKSIYDPVKRLYLQGEGRWACAIQKFCLRYFIRIEREEGLDLAFRAMTLRDRTGCYRSLVEDVLVPFYSPELEARIVKVFLAEREPEVIVNISRVLKKRGSAAVVDALLEQLERLDPKPVGGGISYDTEAGAHREIRGTLFRIGGGPSGFGDEANWKLTPEQKSRLKANLHTMEGRKKFESVFETR